MYCNNNNNNNNFFTNNNILNISDRSFKIFFFWNKILQKTVRVCLEHLPYHVKPIAGMKNAMVPNIWKNFCASDGNVKMRFRIVSKNTKLSTLYTLKGPQLWDGEILQDEKTIEQSLCAWNVWKILRTLEQCKYWVNLSYNWSKKIREITLFKIFTDGITIWLFHSFKIVVNGILTFQSCMSLVRKRWWKRWREQQWTRSWTWKFWRDGPVGYNY